MRSFLVLVAVFMCVVAEPAQAFSIGSNCWPNTITIGVNAEHRYDLVRGANLGWVRITIRWSEVNPSPNVWNFLGVDSRVNAARAQGQQVLAILSTAPEWAGGGPHGNIPPTNINLWKEFVRRTAQRYAGQIAAYEIWNEPNLSGVNKIGIGWDRDINLPPLYADYLKAASNEIRTYAPGTLVVGPGTSSEPNSRTVTIFQQLQNRGASPFMDVVSFHANGTNESSTEVGSRIQSQLNTLGNRNPSNSGKPLWITEMGWWSNSVGEGSQRDRIQGLISGMMGLPGCGLTIPVYVGWARSQFTHAFIFKILDDPGASDGIYRSNATPKPVVTDYLQTLAYPARDFIDTSHVPFSYSCSGLTCTFTSSLLPGESFLNGWWNFGDGSPAVIEGPLQVTHTYSQGGRYFVRNGLTFEGSTLTRGGDNQLIQIP